MSRRKVTAIKKHVETRIPVGVEDMVLLPNLSETGIVENLNARLVASEIYCNIGHVLVACNPYKWLTIYDADWIKRYQHQQRVDVAPHVFATAEAAYRTMVTEEDSQCIIISGESGAGKTEASKHIQTYIAGVCGGGESVDKLKKVFLESNPVLEAFGNAKTLRNNNSSRFGKYFVLKFNRFGTPLGGSVTNYLLEKSRIVRPGKGERTFHIFYQLLRSEFCAALKLSGKGDDYQTLSCSGCLAVEGMDDAKEFKVTLEAMRNVGISNKQIQSILSLVASILHIGNVSFQSKEIGDAEGSKIMNKDALLTFCDFCKVDEAKIAHVLIFREMQTAGPSGKTEVYQVPQNPVQAAARRDAIAKAVFEKLFDLIVERINVALAVNASGTVDEDEMVSIGVLDIYGFEIFEQNGFEQLCINYVNEKLQQIFIELTLRAEQDEYEREGIAWTPIPFFNNKIVCDLLDESRPAGVFRILDDVAKTLHGSQDMPAVDRKFLETATQVHGRHEHFKNVSGAFTIKHYAGDVVYTAKGGFVESNKDSLNPDLYAVLEASTDKLVQRLFPPLPDVGAGKKAAVSSASSKIRTQCNALVSALMDCQPHYVRCIKSNDQKKALSIDSRRVQHQVKYLGLLENIKVRRAGFAYRAEYHRFLSRFGILSTATYPEWTGSDKDGCRKIMAAIAKKIASIDREEVQLGKTKIFIRQPESYFAIERLREVRLGDFVAAIQRAWRRYKSSKDFITMQTLMAKWYADERKCRRRDSIFRPYAGDYLDALGARAEVVREGLFRIIDHYNVNENVLFADASCGQLRNISRTDASRTVCDGCAFEEKLVVLTDSALYLIDIVSAGYFAKHFPKEVIATKSLPAVVLRRRIRLHRSKGEGCLTGVSVSKLADPCMTLLVRPESQLKPPRVDHFVADTDPSAGKCAASGIEFGLFTRRHHCRLSGNCYTDACSRYTQSLPDSGYYHEQRVADNYIGLESTDLVEDVLLVCARRTELISILNQRWQILECGGSLPVSFSNAVKLTGGLTGDNGGGSHGFFSSAGALQQPSVLAAEVVFSEGAFASPPKQKRGARSAPGVVLTAAETLSQTFEVRVERDRQGKFLISSPAGLSHDVVIEKQKRAAKRQKAKLEKRKKLDAERQERAAVREAQRENDRMARLSEKKAQKAAEKAAKKESEQQATEVESARVQKQKPRPLAAEAKPVTGGANNELAAALARRKANP